MAPLLTWPSGRTGGELHPYMHSGLTLTLCEGLFIMAIERVCIEGGDSAQSGEPW